MRFIIILVVIVMVGMLCGCHQTRYEYESFDWPKSTDSAKVLFYTVADETTTNGPAQWINWVSLHTVLERAQEFDWEYVGAVGETCVLRRPARATPTDPAALTGRFVVETLAFK
ncbi:MAG TPA: hypothetical protein VG347_11755 [Verrucomicrobiae bacterium]|nr:hypothetical protein [Verrucomicrobiae bacterium]